MTSLLSSGEAIATLEADVENGKNHEVSVDYEEKRIDS
jgi:hypothetical protein